MNLQRVHEQEEVHMLFSNSDPESAWSEAEEIISLTFPEQDLALVRTAFEDVLRLFRGEYPGYQAIATPYHDLPHTLSVFICALRLAHGVHLSGKPLTGQEMVMIMLATLFHDVGYAQPTGSEMGTGAQFTRTHVIRGIDFMRAYGKEHGFPDTLTHPVNFLMQGTDHIKGFSRVRFPSERLRFLGQIVGTADLVGQMADRLYLEKLMYLYYEFREAGIGNYQSILDLFGRSHDFYKNVISKLETEMGGVIRFMPYHFQARLGVMCNYYLEAIEKNIVFLGTVMEQGEQGFALLRRGGVLQQISKDDLSGI